MSDTFTCLCCNTDNDRNEIVKQRCGHIICLKCLGEYVNNKLDIKISCPIEGCTKFISDGNVRKVLSDEVIKKYEQLHMDKVNEKRKCLLPNCPYDYVCSEQTMRFDCPTCSLFNCISCKAAHKSLTCDQYKQFDEAQDICKAEMNRAMKKLKTVEIKMNRDMFIELDDQDLMHLDTYSECGLCYRNLVKEDMIVLRCYHIYCRYCLNNHAQSATIPICCPNENCATLIQEREIFALLSEEDFRIYINRCNSRVFSKLDYIFQCQTGDCPYFVTYSTIPDMVLCPLCGVVNCTKCFVIHSNETCEQFKIRIKGTAYEKHLLIIEEKIRSKEWMRCLKCHQILKKITGCSWIQCTNCSFEMCWALQMRRWGPNGRDDESDGCKCQLKGPRCAPDCGSCEPHQNVSNGSELQIDEEFRRLRDLLLLMSELQ